MYLIIISLYIVRFYFHIHCDFIIYANMEFGELTGMLIYLVHNIEKLSHSSEILQHEIYKTCKQNLDYYMEFLFNSSIVKENIYEQVKTDYLGLFKVAGSMNYDQMENSIKSVTRDGYFRRTEHRNLRELSIINIHASEVIIYIDNLMDIAKGYSFEDMMEFHKQDVDLQQIIIKSHIKVRNTFILRTNHTLDVYECL